VELFGGCVCDRYLCVCVYVGIYIYWFVYVSMHACLDVCVRIYVSSGGAWAIGCAHPAAV